MPRRTGEPAQAEVSLRCPRRDDRVRDVPGEIQAEHPGGLREPLIRGQHAQCEEHGSVREGGAGENELPTGVAFEVHQKPSTMSRVMQSVEPCSRFTIRPVCSLTVLEMPTVLV